MSIVISYHVEVDLSLLAVLVSLESFRTDERTAADSVASVRDKLKTSLLPHCVIAVQ